MIIKFYKYQGLGNDFVLLEHDQSIPLNPETIRFLCDRRFGIGADGLLVFEVITPGQSVRMSYFNADGTGAETCFNGLRCIALHSTLMNYIPRSRLFQIQSDIGDISAKVLSGEDTVQLNLPGAIFAGSPGSDNSTESAYRFTFGTLTGTSLSMGNPHFVAWSENPDLDELNDYIIKHGREVEKASHFEHGTNFELAALENDTTVHMAVWERGVGRTLACGSGATATVCAGVRTGRLKHNTPVTVRMAGGSLIVTVPKDNNRVDIEGEARFVFSGVIEI